MTKTEQAPSILPYRDKITMIAKECLKLPVQRYAPEHNGVFQEQKFNGCLAFVRFVLTGAGIPIPDYIGPDGIQRPMKYVREYFDHFGISISLGKQQAGDLVFFSWDGVCPQHIGIYAGEDSYIHAHTSDGLVHKNRLAPQLVPTDNPNSLYATYFIGFKRPTIVNPDPCWPQKPIA